MTLLTDTIGWKSEPITENASTFIIWIKSQKPVKSVLLFTFAAFSTKHFFMLKSEKKKPKNQS